MTLLPLGRLPRPLCPPPARRLATALIAACACILLLGGAPRAVAAETLRVAAAANLSHALPEIAADFERASEHAVKISFGASGNLSRQIRRGAPFALFLGADESYVEALAADGFGAAPSAVYARGALALYAPEGSPVAVDGDLAGLAAALDAGRLRRFAVASPDHAPYGRLARSALQRAGLWERLQPLLVNGENAAQTAQFATTGAVDAALIPHSLAGLPALARRGRSAALNESLAPPLRQRMLLIDGRDGVAARAFFAYLRGAAARAVLLRHGFAAAD